MPIKPLKKTFLSHLLNNVSDNLRIREFLLLRNFVCINNERIERVFYYFDVLSACDDTNRVDIRVLRGVQVSFRTLRHFVEFIFIYLCFFSFVTHIKTSLTPYYVLYPIFFPG